jgi:glycerol-1-phosphate dehydrogenase [NAD(P)+]
MPTRIETKQDYLSRDSNGLAKSTFTCPDCGKDHNIPIGEMRAGRGLVNDLPSVIQRVLGRQPRSVQVVYDRAIEEIIQTSVIQQMARDGIPFTTLPLGEDDHLLDSEIHLGDAAAARVEPETDILIGAGSGVICDLAKWIATRKDLPYIIVGTAPSMNAYTSITATITEQDVKFSRLLNPADAVLLDVDILAQAPMPMIHAGMGDLAARAICNADWKLANLLHGLYFCPFPFEMTAENETAYLGAAAEIAKREPQAIQILSEAVLKSGLSMTVLDGETSPSSGAEHVLSHFWDLLTHTRGLPKNLHGAQVGIATIIMIAFYHYMRRLEIGSIDPQTVLRKRPTIEVMTAENSARYGQAGALFNQVVLAKYLSDDALRQRIHWVQANWDRLWQELDPYIPELDTIRGALLKAGVPLTLSSIQRSKADALEAMVKGPQYRTRYTLLDLAWELGLMPEAAEEVLDLAGVLG